MSNNYFQFKQFTVRQDRCAMKVGTDGTLLGAWVQVASCRNVLDVGTGTGLIALMIAQRNKEALIDGIDIDRDACTQASENVAASPFTGQIQIHHTSFQHFEPNNGLAYNLIVSNPPYFIQSLKCPEEKRRLARHNDELPLSGLFEKSRSLLTPDGRLALILPYQQQEELLRQADRHKFYCIRQTEVIPVEGVSPKRLLVELALQPPPSVETNRLILENKLHQRTAAYMELTGAFYLVSV
jgi:tRNA1Val (adenine37-N6)-methyltransferase